MDEYGDDVMFAIKLSMTGQIEVHCKKIMKLPDILRILADAIEAGETGLDVITVPWGPSPN